MSGGSVFHERLRTGEVLAGSFVNLGSSLTAEIMALAGFDWLVLDLEHGAGGEQEALAQLQAIAHTGAAGIVRVEAIERARIGRVLDLGADGVLVPRLESAADARLAAECCRYHGRRGVARLNRAWKWGAASGTLAEADASIVCAVQIETAAALAAADDIAAVEGVDVLFVGPADLAHSLGLEAGPDDPDLQRRIAAVAEAASAHGKAAGILVGTLEEAATYRMLGFTFLGCASDSGLLMREARRVADGLRVLVERDRHVVRFPTAKE